MDFDIKRRKLRSQLSALGYFDLSGTTLNAFHKNLKTDAAKAREPRYANKLNIDCLHPTSVSDDSGSSLYKLKHTSALPCTQVFPRQPCTVFEFPKSADDSTCSYHQFCEDRIEGKKQNNKDFCPLYSPRCMFLKKRKVLRGIEGYRYMYDELLYKDCDSGLIHCHEKQREYSAPPSRYPLPPRCLSARSDRLLCKKHPYDLDSVTTTHPCIPMHFMYIPPKLKKTDPVHKYYQYKKAWDEREEASEKTKRELIMSIRLKMMQIAHPSPKNRPVDISELQKKKRQKCPPCPYACTSCGRKPCEDFRIL